MGKNNPFYGKKHSKETLDKLSRMSRGKNNPNYGKKTGKAYENIKKAQLKRKEENPEAWIKMSKKGAKVTQEKYPSLFINNLKKYYDEHPNARSQVTKETNRKWKERDPEDYYKKKKEYARLMIDERLRRKKEDPERNHLNHIKSGIMSYESRLEHSPYFWDDVLFLSNEEMKCAKLLLTTPINGINCNIKIGRKIIDFFPQSYDKLYQNKLVEFHPWDWNGLSEEEYYNQRKQAIEESDYKDIPLIVITSLDELKGER